MSGVYIKGMEMPKNHPICIVIDASGQARKYDIVNDKYADDEVFEANNVPDHGDLIDRDVVMARSWDMETFFDAVKDAPTIIPADKEENN